MLPSCLVILQVLQVGKGLPTHCAVLGQTGVDTVDVLLHVTLLGKCPLAERTVERLHLEVDLSDMAAQAARLRKRALTDTTHMILQRKGDKLMILNWLQGSEMDCLPQKMGDCRYYTLDSAMERGQVDDTELIAEIRNGQMYGRHNLSP